MPNKNTLFLVSAIILLFVGVGAAAAGFLLVQKPDGSGLGMPLSMLKNSPFPDFLIPGLVLLIINGIGNLAGAYFLFRKDRLSGLIMLFFGAFLTLWMVAQVYWIGLGHFIQVFYFLIGLVEILLGIALIRSRPE